eukprot:Em0648g12a
MSLPVYERSRQLFRSVQGDLVCQDGRSVTWHRLAKDLAVGEGTTLLVGLVERHFDKGRPNEDYKAKVLWSLNEGAVTAIAADDVTSQLASSCSTNATVTIWNVNKLHIRKDTYQCAWKDHRITEVQTPQHVITTNTNSNGLHCSCASAVIPPYKYGTPNGDVKPLVQLEVPSYSEVLPKEILHVSRNGLLAINNADTVLVWNLGILTAQESPVPPHTTVHCDSTVAITCWLHNNCLATHFTKQIDIWDVNTAISATHERTFQFHYRESNIYTPLRSIHTSHTLTCLCPSNQLLLAGDSSGNVHILDPTNGNCLQVFSKPPHVSTVTDICADGERVISCSKDFSIRVYRWTQDNTTQLESLYTLLGGSVAHKKTIKVYTFAAKLASTVSEELYC